MIELKTGYFKNLLIGASRLLDLRKLKNPYEGVSPETADLNALASDFSAISVDWAEALKEYENTLSNP